MSEFTPANPITAFEILPGGEFVVVASSGSAHPTVLQLRGPRQPADKRTAAAVETTTYGGETTLEVDLSLDFRDDAMAAAAAAASAQTYAAVSRWQPPPMDCDDDTTAGPGRGKAFNTATDVRDDRLHDFRTFPTTTAAIIMVISRYCRCWR